MGSRTYYGQNSQKVLDKKSGKTLDYLQAGIRNCNLKCTTEVFEAAEAIPAGSLIQIGSINMGIVPSFTIIEATKELAGQIGTVKSPNLFGCFSIRADTPSIVMPTAPNEPLKASGGDLFITTIADFPAGGKISIKIMFTRD